MTKPSGDQTILVVDDEPGIRSLVRSILASVGLLTVMEASNGREAYELLRDLKERPAVVITDIRMPRMNGVELTDRLGVEYPDIKVVCMSAYAETLSPNCHFFISKPFRSAALLEILRKVFQISTSA
jgi:YesN/AraC family two-component response regulator